MYKRVSLTDAAVTGQTTVALTSTGTMDIISATATGGALTGVKTLCSLPSTINAGTALVGTGNLVGDSVDIMGVP